MTKMFKISNSKADIGRYVSKPSGVSTKKIQKKDNTSYFKKKC